MTDPPIRAVLQVHTRYRQAGGEDHAVEAERQLLEAAGIIVRQVIFDNAALRESRSVTGDLVLAGSAIWSRRAFGRVRAAIRTHRPDVVHVHNTFAAASPSVYWATGGIPIVHTLHNYRMVCPVATAFRNGRQCTDCVGEVVPWPGVLHACVHGSRSRSATVAATLAVHRALGTFRTRVSVYVALTQFQRSLMLRGGLPSRRVRILPNFLEPDPGVGDRPRSGILFAGRLVEEKGITTLLQAAAMVPGQVRVAGTGPLAGAVARAAAAGDITYLGALERAAVLGEMRRSIAVVVPSVWFEGFPLTVVEAYASATPILASRIGSLAELVDDRVTGRLTDPHDADGFASLLRLAADSPEEMARMGADARARYDARYRGPQHLSGLLAAYQQARDQIQGAPVA